VGEGDLFGNVEAEARAAVEVALEARGYKL